MARPTGVGRALSTYTIPIEGRDEWLAAARRLAREGRCLTGLSFDTRRHGQRGPCRAPYPDALAAVVEAFFGRLLPPAEAQALSSAWYPFR